MNATTAPTATNTQSLNVSIDEAVAALLSHNDEAAVRSITALTHHPAADVCEELGRRILATNAQRGTRPIPTSPYLADTTQCQLLIDALETDDTEWLLALVDGNYATFLTTMICALAALEDSIA